MGNYTIGYDYNLVGQMKSITDPAGAVVNYSFDSAGRPSSVTGSSFGGVTTYASGPQYRAWGGLKHLDYGNSKVVDVSYNNRMQVSGFTVPSVLSKTYEYHADGSLRFSNDALNHKFDRSYSYDHAARLKEALSGAEARGEPTTNDRPYKQTFSYDTFSHLTNRDSNVWTDVFSTTDSYANDRRTGWSYDAAGNLLENGEMSYTYDAAGHIGTVATFDPQSTTTRSLDGNGRQVKTVASTFNEETQTWTTSTTYYIRSSVLRGQVLTELNEAGTKHRTFVYAGTQVLATQKILGTSSYQQVTWEHRDPGDASYRTTMSNGGVSESAELDPTGANAGLTAPIIPLQGQDEGTGSLLPYPSFSNPSRPGVGYSVDGIPVSWDYFRRVLDNNYHGSFSGGSLRSSTIGYRTSGSRFGHPYTEARYFDRRAPSISLGDFDPNLLSNPLPNIASPIYGSSSWSLLGSLVGAQQPNPAPQDHPVERKAAQKAIDILKENRRCRDFIRDLIANTRSEFGVTLDAANVDIGIGLENYIMAIDAGRVNASGVSGESKKGTVYGVTTGHDTVKWNKEFYKLNDYDQGLHTLHESLHQLLGFSDQVLARAASRNTRTFASTEEGMLKASSYLNEQIQSHCGRPQTTPQGSIFTVRPGN